MERDELLKLLRSDVAGFNKFREENPRLAIDFSAADLSKADLKGADLRRINLRGSKLRGANLAQSEMSNADLEGADLSGADLDGANLHRAKLRGASLEGVKMSFSSEGRMCLNPASFEDVSWSREQLVVILEVLNLNRHWRITYQIEAK